jgi:hypothetical protein
MCSVCVVVTEIREGEIFAAFEFELDKSYTTSKSSLETRTFLDPTDLC